MIESFPHSLLDVINTDLNSGFGLVGTQNELITLSKTPLFGLLIGPQESDKSYYDLFATKDNKSIAFIDVNAKNYLTDIKDKISDKTFVSQLNGHPITSGLFVAKDLNTTLFTNGSFVLFARQWFIELSDTFNQFRPFVIKDLKQMLCSEETNDTTDKTDPMIVRQTTTTTTTPVPEPESIPVLMFGVLILIIVLLLLLILFLWFYFQTNQQEIVVKKNVPSNRESVATKNLQNSVPPEADLPRHSSDIFRPNSGNDYSKPISTRKTQQLDQSFTDLDKPTDIKIN